MELTRRLTRRVAHLERRRQKESMKLTRIQYRVLKAWLRCHATGNNFAQLLRRCWPQWLSFAVLSALLFFFLVPFSPESGWLSIGLLLGAFFRDIGYHRASSRTWPVTEQLIDWKRVSELVESHEQA